MKRTKYLPVIAAFVTLIILTGCPGSFNEPQGPVPEPGKGFVVLQFGVGRTLLPTNIVYAAYKLDFIAVDSSGNPDTTRQDAEEGGAGTIGGIYELEEGHWKLDVRVFSDAAGLILLASATGVGFEIDASAQIPVVVPVSLLFAPITTTGTGTLQYTITNNSGAISDAEIMLEGLSGQADRNIVITSNLSDSDNAVPIGYYLATVRLEKDRITLDGDRYLGASRSFWSDILHIYPGNTTPLAVTFETSDFYNGIGNVWLVGGMTNWNAGGALMTKQANETYSWSGLAAANAHFRFSLTDTTTWSDANNGAWFVPVTDGLPVTIGSTGNAMTFMPIHHGNHSTPNEGSNRAWDIGAAGYYEITLDPVARRFIAERPDIAETVTISGPGTVIKGKTAVFTAVVGGKNNPVQTVTWSIFGVGSYSPFTELTSIDPATGILTVDASETAATLTVRAESTAAPGVFDEVTVDVEFPAITNIAVTGPASSADQGTDNLQFNAVVTFADDAQVTAPRTVTWSVALQSGTKHPDTDISSAGVLTIADDEAVGVLVITATSTYITSANGTAELEVTPSGGPPTVISVTVTSPNTSILRGGTEQFSAAVDVSGGAAQTVIWSLSGDNSSATTISSGGLLTVGTDETATSLTVTAASMVDGTKSDSKTLNIPAIAALPQPNTVTLSSEGIAAWAASTPDTNVASYSVQLNKGGAAEGSPVSVTKGGTYTADFLQAMRDAGVDSYTVTVTAVPADAYNYSSTGATSSAQNVTQRTAVNDIFWWENWAQWANTDTAGGYSVRIYRNAGSSPIHEEANVARISEPHNGGTKSQFDSSTVKTANGIGLYTFSIMARGDDKLVLDSSWSAVSSGDRGVTGYSPFGNSSVWAIVEGGGRFVAGGEGGKIFWSNNGTHWTAPTLNVFGSGDTIKGIAYAPNESGLGTGNGLFVAVGSNAFDQERVAYSDDGGDTWTAGSVSGIGDRNILNNVIYTGESTGAKFIAVGNFGQVVHSVDGESWTRLYADTAGGRHLNGIAYDNINTTFVAAGQGGVAIYSDNGGLGWGFISNDLFNTIDNGSGSIDITGITFGADKFVVVGGNGNIKLATSANIISYGNKWYAWGDGSGSSTNPVTSGFGANTINSITFNGSQFMAVGANGRISTSTNGTAWTAIPVGEADGQTQFNERENITAVGFGGGKFILHGNRYESWGGGQPNPNMGKMAAVE
ncbi:MAG: hypothetical protein FWG89_05385 [Treponema sp.]|nr:hypothetical protein [Treponema sp.]